MGFDPNPHLQDGYQQIISDFRVKSNTSHVIKTMCFEHTNELLDELEPFDFAFTSPPFFDYEEYGDFVPNYTDWIEQFYSPLFKITHDHLKPYGYFVLYLADTTAGCVEQFMMEQVPTFTSFVYKGKIGLQNGHQKTIRCVHLFQRF